MHFSLMPALVPKAIKRRDDLKEKVLFLRYFRSRMYFFLLTLEAISAEITQNCKYLKIEKKSDSHVFFFSCIPLINSCC